ncbi:Uncharacterised protein [Mycobacteroides abscessus subsp. massiliense]|nr:Uncharacterised protein [Mycobacteroides abscessus subsp. massiliense]
MYPQIALIAVATPIRATLERVLGPASVTSPVLEQCEEFSVTES